MLPYLDKLDSQGGIDILTLNHTVDAFDGLFDQIRGGESVEQEGVEFLRRFEVVEDGVEKHKGGCRIGSGLQSLVQQLLQLSPVLDVNNRKEQADQSGDSFLDEELLFLDVLIEQQPSKLNFLLWIQILVQIDKISFEEDGGHLSMSKFGGVDEDEGEDAEGGGILGEYFEDFGGVFDFLVVAGEGLLDEVDHLFGREVVVVHLPLHSLLKIILKTIIIISSHAWADQAVGQLAV